MVAFNPPPKFSLGRVVATPGVLAALVRNQQMAGSFLRRHQRGDWGEVDAEDMQTNDAAVRQGARILSAYRLTDGTRIWIITEADRSATTVLLPEEY